MSSPSDRREKRGQHAAANALMVRYLRYIAERQTDAGFQEVIGSTLQNLRRTAQEQGLVVREEIGLSLTEAGRALAESSPRKS